MHRTVFEAELFICCYKALELPSYWAHWIIDMDISSNTGSFVWFGLVMWYSWVFCWPGQRVALLPLPSLVKVSCGMGWLVTRVAGLFI